MYFIYSLLLALGFIFMLPAFVLRREKYAAGFRQRLGNYPDFKNDGRPVIWLHCVSVGETNAARPLVDALQENYPDHRLVFSTTTKTGQELAQKIFSDKATVVYLPFDFKFSVRRAIETYKPSLVLLMETEIWPRFIREAKLSGAKVAIVNGRLAEKSFSRYSKIRSFISRVLADVDLALMQGEADANRLTLLGVSAERTTVTGNLKFDVGTTETDSAMTETLRERFGFDGDLPLIVVASTHDPEERWILEALDGEPGNSCRLLIAPRHPERFDVVSDYLKKNTDYNVVRRSSPKLDTDKQANVILLDSVGELRAVYPLANIVFVGGSLIRHGGQSILEPAAAGKPIVTGYYTHNFANVVSTFLENKALIQFPDMPVWTVADKLFSMFSKLLEDPELCNELGRNAASVMKANRGATSKTVEYLTQFYEIAGS